MTSRRTTCASAIRRRTMRPISSAPPIDVVEIPFTWGLDDFPAFEYVTSRGGIQQGLSSPSAVYEIWAGDFDYLYDRIGEGVYTLTMHPQVIGRGHRLADVGEAGRAHPQPARGQLRHDVRRSRANIAARIRCTDEECRQELIAGMRCWKHLRISTSSRSMSIGLFTISRTSMSPWRLKRGNHNHRNRRKLGVLAVLAPELPSIHHRHLQIEDDADGCRISPAPRCRWREPRPLRTRNVVAFEIENVAECGRVRRHHLQRRAPCRFSLVCAHAIYAAFKMIPAFRRVS